MGFSIKCITIAISESNYRHMRRSMSKGMPHLNVLKNVLSSLLNYVHSSSSVISSLSNNIPSVNQLKKIIKKKKKKIRSEVLIKNNLTWMNNLTFSKEPADKCHYLHEKNFHRLLEHFIKHIF